MEELLPCPFCGANKRGHELDTNDDSDPELDGRDWDSCLHFISCLRCGARGPVTQYERGKNVFRESGIRWNHRSPSPKKKVEDADPT